MFHYRKLVSKVSTPYALLEEDLTVSRKPNGIVVSAMLPDRLVTKTFIFYTEDEAIETFITLVSDGLY